MAYTEVYVDPSIAADSGTGTIGDPYGDLEYAIEQTTFDTTNGTRLNVKAGTDEVLAAQLSTGAMSDTGTTPAWVPTASAPMVIQGYTSTAGDGGIGGISGGGSVSIINSGSRNGIRFIDMHLHNCGANPIVSVNNDCAAIRCELDGTTLDAFDADSNSYVSDCYIHDTGRYGIQINFGEIYRNFLQDDTTSSMTEAIRLLAVNTSIVSDNIILLGGLTLTGIGIRAATRSTICNNSIYHSGAGTGSGISIQGGGTCQYVANNVISGFSGTGGKGIEYNAATMDVFVEGGNAVYNCATAYSGSARNVHYSLGDNETLSAEPFTDAANGDFSPVDTGNVKEGSVPQVIGGGLV